MTTITVKDEEYCTEKVYKTDEYIVLAVPSEKKTEPRVPIVGETSIGGEMDIIAGLYVSILMELDKWVKRFPLLAMIKRQYEDGELGDAVKDLKTTTDDGGSCEDD